MPECLGHPAGTNGPAGAEVYCDGSCRRPSSFREFTAVPATGPTYTDLARENERLHAANEVLRVQTERDTARYASELDRLDALVSSLTRDTRNMAEHIAMVAAERDSARAEAERLKEQVATLIAGQQRNGEARQQAILDFAHELAEMEPEAREKAIRRIIDGSNP